MALEDTLRDLYNERIDENRPYDRDYWVEKMDKLNDLEKYYSRFKKDPTNPDHHYDLGYVLHKNSKFYNEFQNPASIIAVEGERAYETWTDAMAKYAQRNIDDFFYLFEDKDWISLILNIPLYKTLKDDYHDKFVEAKWELDKIKEASSSQDFSKISGYVESKFDELPEWFKSSISFLSGNREYISAIFKEFAEFAENKLQKEFYIVNGKDAKVDKGKLQRIVEDSLDIALEQHNLEKDEGDKKDIWDRDIRNCYMTIAKIVFPREEKERDWEKDEEEEEIKEERRKYGLTQ
jgi:hypothetical protein